MSAVIEPLPWDSEFFGASIGRVALDGADESSLAAIDAEARSLGIECLYGSLDPIDGQTTTKVQKSGWCFVDAATTFDLKQDEPPIRRPEGVEFRVGTLDDVPNVEPFVTSMAAWTRYAMDPRFGLDAAERLERAWLDRAVRAEDGVHSLMVAEQEGEIIAFIGRVLTPAPRVDAVGTTRRGSGAARYLIEEARGWAGDQPLLGGPIAARNVAALRYVSHCGYRVCRVEYVYHRWLDED